VQLVLDAQVPADIERNYSRHATLGFMLVMPSAAMSDPGCHTSRRRAARPERLGAVREEAKRVGSTRMVRLSSRPCLRLR